MAPSSYGTIAHSDGFGSETRGNSYGSSGDAHCPLPSPSRGSGGSDTRRRSVGATIIMCSVASAMVGSAVYTSSGGNNHQQVLSELQNVKADDTQTQHSHGHGSIAGVMGSDDRFSRVFRNPDYTKAAPVKQTTDLAWPDFGATNGATISVDPTTVTAQMSEFYLGANLPSYVTSDLMSTSESYLNATGASFLRYPGGSPADKLLWDGNYTRFPYFSSWSWMTGPAKYSWLKFVDTVKTTGAEPLVQFNFALCLVYGVDQCADYALEWHEAFLAKGVNVTYYEFGNENYGGWEVPYGDVNVTGTLYGAAYSVVSSRLKAKYPHLLIGAAVVDKLVICDKNQTIIEGWTEDLLHAVNEAENDVTVDFMIMHNYFQARFGSQEAVPYQDLLDERHTIKAMVQNVQALYAEANPDDSTAPPVTLSEYNLAELTSPACGATVQFTSAIWHALVLGDTVVDPLSATSLVPFAWADTAKNCTEHLGYKSPQGPVGDYGMLSVNDPLGLADGTPRPHFFTYALFALALGSKTVATTTVASSSHASDDVASCNMEDLHVYASSFEGAETGLIVVNSGAVHCKVTLIVGEGGKGGDTANAWLLRGNTPTAEEPETATGVEWNGNLEPLDLPLTDYYDPYTLNANADGSFVFDVAAFSIAGAVVH